MEQITKIRKSIILASRDPCYHRVLPDGSPDKNNENCSLNLKILFNSLLSIKAIDRKIFFDDESGQIIAYFEFKSPRWTSSLRTLIPWNVWHFFINKENIEHISEGLDGLEYISGEKMEGKEEGYYPKKTMLEKRIEYNEHRRNLRIQQKLQRKIREDPRAGCTDDEISLLEDAEK